MQGFNRAGYSLVEFVPVRARRGLNHYSYVYSSHASCSLKLVQRFISLHTCCATWTWYHVLQATSSSYISTPTYIYIYIYIPCSSKLHFHYILLGIASSTKLVSIPGRLSLRNCWREELGSSQIDGANV